MCVPVGCRTYFKSHNQIRHRHPHCHFTLIFTWYLNFITATAKNSALQRYLIERKVAQSNGETTNSLKHGVWPFGVLLFLSNTENKLQCPCEFTMAPRGPSAWFGNHRPKHSGFCKTWAQFFSVIIFQSHLFPKLPPRSRVDRSLCSLLPVPSPSTQICLSFGVSSNALFSRKSETCFYDAFITFLKGQVLNCT